MKISFSEITYIILIFSNIIVMFLNPKDFSLEIRITWLYLSIILWELSKLGNKVKK